MSSEQIYWTGGDKPTHNLCIKRKDQRRVGSSAFVQVGVGWQNEKGQISIRLDAGVSLNWRDCDDLWITLFPNTPGGKPNEDH